MTDLLEKFGAPPVASEHGHGLDNLSVYVHLLMLILFVGWLGYFVMALFKFKKGANPKADYVGVKGHMSTYIEIGVAVVEAVLLIGLAVPLWARAVDRFPTAADNPLEIQVMAQQFAWNAHFTGPDNKFGKQDMQFANQTNPFGIDSNDAASKDDVTTLSNEPFLLPVNKPVIVRLSSMDVIHCFKAPAMRVTQDAIPGMVIPLHFTPVKTGSYTITCAQLCGSGHSTMKGNFKVVEQPEYDKWYAEKAKAGGGASFE
ncbi:MAG TPA: cytochrome c oxidase subunit II [Candidatus Limnocylindria bacterium]|jgi:cytochrome c oxidase subunit 2|nr:cytochrome c oxidase subunit II [Candidatus Limnocylindria bacterium]